MSHKLIKICGIRDTGTAQKAAQLGVNFVGLVFHPESIRHVTLQQAIDISDIARQSGATPVAVFVNQNSAEMKTICTATNIQVVQLHGETARAHHHLLPSSFQRIYVKNLSNTHQLEMHTELKSLEPERDFILLDHTIPGQGNQINLKHFQYHLAFRWLLAGGLTPSNVSRIIHDIQPDGVDVSSGVESLPAIKNSDLIRKFVTSVRGYNDAR